MYKSKNLIGVLVDYIKKNLKKGYTKESLKWALIDQGYSKMEVEKAIKKADEELANEAPVLKTQPEIKYEVLDHKHDKEDHEHKKKGFVAWLAKIFSS